MAETQMAQALAKAGVKPKPLIQRVWQHIKDHPDSSLEAIAAVYGPTTAQTVHALYLRKMLVRKSESRLIKGYRRDIFLYRAAMPEYELLPLPKTKPQPVQPAKPVVTLATAPAAAPAPAPSVRPAGPMLHQSPAWPQPVAPASDWPASYVDGLTVRDARLLFDHLKKLFT